MLKVNLAGSIKSRISITLCLLLMVWPVKASHQNLAGDLCTVPKEAMPAEPFPQLAVFKQQNSTLTVLAIGSSSTSGIGASSKAHSYPSQLERMLKGTLPGIDIKMINRGKPGATIKDNLPVLLDMINEKPPDLVLWQVGTNDALRKRPLDQIEAELRQGSNLMMDQKIPLLLIDLQYLPHKSSDHDYLDVVRLIRHVADKMNVPVLGRYEAMRYWFEERQWPLSLLLAKDQLHLTDQSYFCLSGMIYHWLTNGLQP